MRCCPAGAESNDVATVFCLGVVFEDERFAEAGLLHWRQDDKLLVGCAAVVHGHAARLEGVADLQGEGVGVLTETVVFAVAEEGDELQPEKPALGEDGAVLLHICTETTLETVVGEHEGFAEERAAFRAADGEGIAERCEIPERDVVVFCAEGVSHACSVDIQQELVVFADVLDSLQFFQAVECAVFGWL